MFGDEMVALFGEYLEEDAREGLRNDMALVGPAEAAEYFGRADGILEGYVISAERLDPCLHAVLVDARRRAREARLIAEAAKAEL